MYPPLPNCHSTQVAIVTLPDGRRVRAQEEGYHEGSTNAWVETSELELTWEETGEELADEEVEAVIEHEGVVYHGICAYLFKFAKWEAQ
jgi:hypothetical protein